MVTIEMIPDFATKDVCRTKASLLRSYKNGNYQVSMYSDGTKIRESKDNALFPEFPESIDLKITNRCDLGCPYCHEESHLKGDHAYISSILNYVNGLPQGVELALGGGNVGEYPELSELLRILFHEGFICNITVNSRHLNGEFQNRIICYRSNGWIKGLGISYEGKIHSEIHNPNVVYHVIAGVTPFDDIMSIVKGGHKVLILGYKQHGRGVRFYENASVLASLMNTKLSLWKLLVHNKNIVSFDNLAIEQLDVKYHLSIDEWQQFYMGDDGTFTMYVDAVDRMFAKSSVSEKYAASTAITDFRTLAHMAHKGK